jgi:hypothetical protein
MFTDENGEPAIFRHICDTNLVGQPMAFDEMHKFAVETLAKMFCSGEKPMELCHSSTKFGIELPNLVLKSVNGKIYYIAVSPGAFPNTSTKIDNIILQNMIVLARKNQANAAIAEMGFCNADNMFGKPIMGGNFFIKYDGLKIIYEL